MYYIIIIVCKCGLVWLQSGTLFGADFISVGICGIWVFIQLMRYQEIANHLERPISKSSSGPEQVGWQGYRIMNGIDRVATSNISWHYICYFCGYPFGRIGNEQIHKSDQSKAFVKPWPVFQSVHGEFQPHSTSLWKFACREKYFWFIWIFCFHADWTE